jgi:L-threonylcarbamoyladenylate synthase
VTNAETLARAVERLRSGGLVAFPTETVYGLGADARSERAVARVFALKGRPATNPLIVHVSDVAAARSAAGEWTDGASRLAREFWPGPLTIVLPRADDIPDIVTAGSPNVALRCPDHPLTLALLREFGGPIVGPSANPSGGVSPTTAAHVREAFDDRDVLVLDGGACTGGIESTVVSLAQRPARVLRPGLISAEQISSVLGAAVVDFTPGAVAGDVPSDSPGLMRRHYAPRTKALLVDRADIAHVLAGEDGVCIVLSPGPMEVVPPHAAHALPADARGYAAGLYAALRRADSAGAGLIVLVRPSREQLQGHERALWLAILDRLERAST